MENSELIKQLDHLISEEQNPETMDIDLLDTLSVVEKLNQQDHLVSQAISKILPDIGHAVDCIVNAFKQGGRLVYLGAGTSGRLGILDAVECVPTFGVDDNCVVGVMAGGKSAMFRAIEGSEDSKSSAVEDLAAINLSSKDVLVGIAASGRTPYVMGGLQYAQQLNTCTVCISSNPAAEIIQYSDISLIAIVGPEPLTGSTRMKSGSAQKMLLNMLSTASMIRIGKSYKNLMVDVKATNQKLYARGTRMVMQITGVDQDIAAKTLDLAEKQVKPAILMLLAEVDFQTAQKLLENADGFLRNALKLSNLSVGE